MAACARPFSRLSFVLALGASLPALSPAVSPAWAGAALIYVTNSAGDSIHVIDPATNKVVQEIKGVEAAHGIAPARRRRAGLCQQRGRQHPRRVRPRERRADQESPAQQPSQQYRGDQERRSHPGRHRARAGRGRRDRCQDPDPDQEHPGQRAAAQHLRDAGRQARDHRLDSGQALDRHRSRATRSRPGSCRSISACAR